MDTPQPCKSATSAIVPALGAFASYMAARQEKTDADRKASETHTLL